MINLVFNSFNPNLNQQIALDSWKHLREAGLIKDIYDIQFASDPIINHHDINTIHSLKRSSLDLCTGGNRNLPVVTDIIQSVRERCNADDHIIFTNNDIIINSNLIKYINKNNPDAVVCSRMNIQPINSFNDILNKNIVPDKIEIWGYDTFVVRADWWLEHSKYFNDYLLGMPIWDNVFASIIKLFGGNHNIGNTTPPFCFHVTHPTTWQNQSNLPESVYNHTLLNSNKLDRLFMGIIDNWHLNYIHRRQPAGRFFKTIPQEKVLEQNVFNILH
jgi:hypothetical protein